MNIVQELIDVHGKSRQWIAWKLGCSDGSVGNWYAGAAKPSNIYQRPLERLLEIETRKEKE